MKKKISFLLGIALIMALMLGGCGTDEKKTDYNGTSYDSLKEQMQTNIYYVTSVMPMVLEQQGFTVSDLEDENTVRSLTAGGVPEYLCDAAASYSNAANEYGECTNFTFNQDDPTASTDPEDIGFSIDKAGKTLTTAVKLELEKDGKTRKVDFQVVYNYNTMEITGITVDPVQSMGEKMSKAGLNTLISMCIVFAVLILISLIIFAFKVFPYLEQKKKEKQKAQEQTNPINVQGMYAPEMTFVPPVEERVQETADDTELIAVIAAAIAASEGTSTGDFVVRSINRRR